MHLSEILSALQLVLPSACAMGLLLVCQWGFHLQPAQPEIVLAIQSVSLLAIRWVLPLEIQWVLPLEILWEQQHPQSCCRRLLRRE